MLKLRDIQKTYRTGAVVVNALDGVSLDFRPGELVAVLGPSGCGKTTLLNIIGGLDRADAGEMSILGRSTREYTQKEMDAYRNNSVGFVFQSYNLISHQSVLANVELALTLSGIGKAERARRAMEALAKVGLADQAKKKPNQLSGGQMQRVAIARALVNDPDVLLADEPTGALDSQTSVQVLDILRDIAKDRLVIMVTHNRDLAEQYATRVIELKDGKVVSDSRPQATAEKAATGAAPRKTAMSYLTALALSFNNLLTKRGRTLITAFAGSIGIIGIALILSLSNGVNRYIVDVQRDTMESYPIVLEEQTFEMTGVMSTMRDSHRQQEERAADRVYINAASSQAMSELQNSVTHNNLTAFKAYLDKPDSPFKPLLSEVRYGYEARFDILARNGNGEIMNVTSGQGMGRFGRAFANMLPFGSGVVTELLPASPEGLVGEEARERYTLLAGHWPKNAREIVLILDRNNEIADYVLYQLGLLTPEGLQQLLGEDAEQQADALAFRYEDLLGHEYWALSSGDTFVQTDNGLFLDVRDDSLRLQGLLGNARALKVSGIVRLEDEQAFTQGGLGHTRALTDDIIAQAGTSAAVKAQLLDESRSVLTGLRFAPQNDAGKGEDLKTYLAGMTPEMKAEFAMQALAYLPELMEQSPDPGEGEGGLQLPGGMSPQQLGGMMGMFSAMQQGNAQQGSLPGMDAERLSGLLDSFLETADPAGLALLYDRMVAPDLEDLDATLSRLGMVNPDMPKSISLYTDTFEKKEEIARLITEYNQNVSEVDQIVYTDFVALMISGVTTIINAISYVLIAFVAVSLVVSSIMIGIITYISVLERTKEIGILRAIGASRRDVARVFTAEAFIIGLAAGLMGIAISLALLVPINAIIRHLTQEEGVRAILPLGGALILIGISALLSLLAGWLPSRIAAKKDPVVALRTE